MEIYCGNNGVNPSLVNGTKILGTRRQCLRKGIGKGLNMPYDPEYDTDYQPIYVENIYCGDSQNLPNGYDRFGSLNDCLTKGIGIGKSIVASNGPVYRFNLKKFITLSSLNLIFLGIAIFLLYRLKPSVILDQNRDIDTRKFILWSLIFTVILIIIFIGIWFLF